MGHSYKRPFIFFVVSFFAILLFSEVDYHLYHFFINFVAVFVSLMMFILAINSKVYSERSAYFLFAIAYLYVGNLDFIHLLSVEGISFFTKDPNESFHFFMLARSIEGVTAILIVGKVVKVNTTRSYVTMHVLGSLILISQLVLLYLGRIPVYFVGLDKTVVFFSITLIIGILYIIVLIMIPKNEVQGRFKVILSTVYSLKLIAILFLVLEDKPGDFMWIIHLGAHFFSYAGLYFAFVQQTVTNPYNNLYQYFESKEKELISLSQTDSLTGVYNHSLTFQKIEESIKKIGQTYTNLCVILFDLDNFKGINDTYGHIKGDEMLLELTKAFNSLQLFEQIVGRYGGDEFVLAIPNMDEDDIHELFKMIEIKLNEVAENTGIRLTFSAGTVLWQIGDNATDMIRKADIKMYQAKEKGKNQYLIWEKVLKAS